MISLKTSMERAIHSPAIHSGRDHNEHLFYIAKQDLQRALRNQNDQFILDGLWLTKIFH